MHSRNCAGGSITIVSKKVAIEMMDEEIPALAGAIYREKVRRARLQSIEQRLLAGSELFVYATSIARAGIQHQHPTWTPEQVRAELRRRMQLSKRLDYLGYSPSSEPLNP